MLDSQNNITQLRFVDSIILYFNLILEKGVKKGKKLKAPHYTNTIAIHNYITVLNIIPNTSNSFFVVAIYI